MTKPLLPRRLRKAVKYGPWGYRFWREAARLPYNALLKTPAVVEIEPYFPAHAELLARYETVRAEVLTHSLGKAVPANHEIMRHQKTFYDHDKIAWGMIPLRAYGLDYPKNMERFPTLGRFLKAHREVKSATISVFPPGKHLRPHKGPFKGVWRYHLGLYVKEFEDGTTAGELVVDGKKYYLR
ncbi:MAG: aspartyl/asparaginyl beta-hydroxylase domain-containing protein, partial [Pseudomonadota bacterium]